MYKQTIVLRDDLGLSRGKLAAQAAHASLKAWKKADSRAKKEWESEGSRKVVVCVKGEDELIEVRMRSEKLGIPSAMIRDAGLTEVAPGTKTALAIGPAESKKIDRITSQLPLLK